MILQIIVFVMSAFVKEVFMLPLASYLENRIWFRLRGFQALSQLINLSTKTSIFHGLTSRIMQIAMLHTKIGQLKACLKKLTLSTKKSKNKKPTKNTSNKSSRWRQPRKCRSCKNSKSKAEFLRRPNLNQLLFEVLNKEWV